MSLPWFTEEVHQSSPLMELLEVVCGRPSCLLAYSLSGSSTHTLVLQARFIESTLVYPLCLIDLHSEPMATSRSPGVQYVAFCGFV